MGTFAEYTGKMIIADEKKEEFSEWVCKILNYGGMMQFEEVSMYGHDMGLLKPIEIYPGGKINFHYNYFEDDAWENAGYDANDCHFYSNKVGGSEFCEVITAIHFLYEVCDDDYGFATINGDIVPFSEFVGWINHLLGTEFSMKKRFSLWKNAETYCLSRLEDKYSKTDFENILDMIPLDLRYAAGGVDFSDLCYIMCGTDTLTEEEISPGTYPADVFECKKAIVQYFEKNPAEDAVKKIWELVKNNEEERRNIVDKGIKGIAENSLFLPARVIVYLAAEHEGEDFWKIWEVLKDDVYHDEKMKQYASDELQRERKEIIEEAVLPISTSEFLCQDGYFTFYDTPEELAYQPDYYISDDDRLYWWDGSDEVRISEQTNEWLKKLAEQHGKIMKEIKEEDIDRLDCQKYFLKVLADTDEFYKRIFPFQTMFYEFLQRGRDKRYVAAVKLFEQLAEENKVHGKIIEKAKCDWDITSSNVTFNIGRLRLKRYLSVMANVELRRKYFGF